MIPSYIIKKNLQSNETMKKNYKMEKVILLNIFYVKLSD